MFLVAVLFRNVTEDHIYIPILGVWLHKCIWIINNNQSDPRNNWKNSIISKSFNTEFPLERRQEWMLHSLSSEVLGIKFQDATFFKLAFWCYCCGDKRQSQYACCFWNQITFRKFEFFTLVWVKVQFFWYLVPCRKVNVNECIENGVILYQ